MNRTQKLYGLLLTLGGGLYALPAGAEPSIGIKPGLPQLNTALFPEQLFWLAVTFGLLYILMSTVALPGVQRAQDKRRNLMASELAAATAANDDARAMGAHYERTLADARATAQATIAEIIAQTTKEAVRREAAQQQELSKRLHEAETKISTARDLALKDMQGHAAELSQAIVEKVIGLKMGAKG